MRSALSIEAAPFLSGFILIYFGFRRKGIRSVVGGEEKKEGKENSKRILNIEQRMLNVE
jgi:hypothetical protein